MMEADYAERFADIDEAGLELVAHVEADLAAAHDLRDAPFTRMLIVDVTAAC